MSTAATQYIHLAPNPNSSYKQLFVKGTRIRARILYGWHMCEEPLTEEEIAAEYNLPLEAVKEAIAYCQSDPVELLEDYAHEEALMEACGMTDPTYKYHPSPRLLTPQERLAIERRVRRQCGST